MKTYKVISQCGEKTIEVIIESRTFPELEFNKIVRQAYLMFYDNDYSVSAMFAESKIIAVIEAEPHQDPTNQPK